MSEEITMMFDLIMTVDPILDAIDTDLLEKFVVKGETLEGKESALPRLPSGRPFHAQTAQGRLLLNFLKERRKLEAVYRKK